MATPVDAQVMRLKVANTSSYVNVLWAPSKDTAWGLALDDDDVLVTLYPGKRGSVLAAKLRAVPAFLDHDDSWVLRRELAEAMFEGVAGVELRRVRIVHDDKVLAGDHVYVDVRTDRMLDRDRAVATYTTPTNPWSGWVKDVDVVQVVGLRPDELVLARVTEFPALFVASPPLVKRWKQLKAPVEVVRPPQGFRAGQPVFPLWSGNPPPMPKLSDGRAVAVAAAVAAFHKALDGDRAARAHAIEHPWLAYGIARLVDREPHGQTRKAAVRHPCSAALYARFVDHGPRNDTREAAAAWIGTATFYAEYVDRKLREPIRKALSRSYTPNDLVEFEHTLGGAHAHD